MSQVKSKSVDHQTLWAIRDARGLSVYEKAFLFVVATRGVMFTIATKAAQDMGMGLTKFYAVRQALLSRGLISVRTRGQGNRTSRTTMYTVNLEAVRALTPPVDEPVEDALSTDGDTATAAHQTPPSRGGDSATAPRTLTIRRATERRSPEGSPEGDHKESPKEASPRSGHDEKPDMSPFMSELLSESRQFTETSFGLVIRVTLYNQKAVAGLEINRSTDPATIAFGGMSPVAFKDFRRALQNRPGLLRELLLALPEEELRLAFDLGIDDYADYHHERMHALESEALQPGVHRKDSPA